jgi:small-conductance mechanosensitive channel
MANELLRIRFLGNSMQTWALALIVLSLSYVLLKTVRKILVAKVAAFAEKTITNLDDLFAELLKEVKPYFVLALSVLIASSMMLVLNERAEKWLHKGIILVVFLQIAVWGNTVIAFWIKHYMRKKAETDSATATTISMLTFLVRGALYVVLALLALNNLGVDITALVAGLGVGGIAIALAVQNILGDLFASLTIVLDRPFVVGDFITVDDYQGTIEQIGLKTTRLRSISGEQVIFSNADLLKSRIRNNKRMNERRVAFKTGVTYATAHEKLEKIPSLIRGIVEKQSGVRFERCHLATLGDWAIVFETVFHMTHPDYAKFMDTQQRINLEILRQFADIGIHLAYPTQTLRVENESQVVAAARHEGATHGRDIN